MNSSFYIIREGVSTPRKSNQQARLAEELRRVAAEDSAGVYLEETYGVADPSDRDSSDTVRRKYCAGRSGKDHRA